MDVFSLMQMHLAMCGIEISSKSSKYHPLNVKNSIMFNLIIASVIVTVLSLNDTTNFNECADVFFRSVSIGICGIVYAIIVSKTSNLSKFISSLADAVEFGEL